MPSLAELQAQMAAAILADQPTPPAILADGIAAGERLAVYRGNTLGNLTDALADAFPVTGQLVGERFFAAAAQAYIRAEPPGAACLADYGGGFPEYLADFAPAAALPYLPDVARLDWAVHRAYHAHDAAALDPRRIAPHMADAGRLHLVPHPSCHLVASRFPVDLIWRAHQGDGDLAAIDVSHDVACRVLVDRRDGTIRLLPLGDGEGALLQALLAGQPLGPALAAAATREPTLDLAPILSRHLHRGTFSDLAPAD